MKHVRFEWDEAKDQANQKKHGVSFSVSQGAFLDPRRVVLEDLEHSGDEQRFYCIGRVGGGIMTVRFTYRNERIRIIGAGYWRDGRKKYEQENQIHE